MKTSHNLRLMCGSVLALCHGNQGSVPEGRFRLDPQRLQTAMSLYTSDLSALVVVEESGSGTLSGTREGEAPFNP